MKQILLFIALKVVEAVGLVVVYTLLCCLYSLFHDNLTPFWHGGGVLLMLGFVFAACLGFAIVAVVEIVKANWKWAGKLLKKKEGE